MHYLIWPILVTVPALSSLHVYVAGLYLSDGVQSNVVEEQDGLEDLSAAALYLRDLETAPSHRVLCGPSQGGCGLDKTRSHTPSPYCSLSLGR